MSERERLRDELREIEGSYSHSITKEKQKRAREIIKKLLECKCRTCGKLYDETKSRAEHKGFCSAKCLHAKALKCGYRKKKGGSEYDALKRHDEVGSVFVVN